MSVSGDGNTLELEIGSKCGDSGDSECKCRTSIPGIRVNKDANIPGITNFTKYTHCRDGDTFKLSRNLGYGHTIKATVGKSKPIDNIVSVSVYYWNSNLDTPILLEIKDTIQGTKYYSYSYDRGTSQGNWSSRLTSGKSLVQLLDDQNCLRNHAIPFNLQDSTSGDLLKDSKSTCINKYRRITESESKLLPPGSEYISKVFVITGIKGSQNRDTKISRVTLRGKPVIFSTPNDAVEKIRLYSYPGTRDVPLMLEFIRRSGGNSTFYESQDLSGSNWIEVGNGNSGFYADKDGIIPQPALSEQLDKVLCSKYNNVTLNLTKDAYGTGRRYCCDEHSKGNGKIFVEKKYIIVGSSPKISYYKHSLAPGTSVAGVYYKDSGGQRKKITLSGVSFPIDGVRNVYAFYCKGDGPSLMYVDSDSAITRGWYQKGDDYNWRWTYTGTKPEDFEGKDLDCIKWMKLKIKLGDCGCDSLQDCSMASGDSFEQLRQELQEELAREEEEAKKERNKAIEEDKKLTQHLPAAPVQGLTSSYISSGSVWSGSVRTNLGRSSHLQTSYGLQSTSADSETGRTEGYDGLLKTVGGTFGKAAYYGLYGTALAGTVGLDAFGTTLERAVDALKTTASFRDGQSAIPKSLPLREATLGPDESPTGTTQAPSTTATTSGPKAARGESGPDASGKAAPNHNPQTFGTGPEPKAETSAPPRGAGIAARKDSHGNSGDSPWIKTTSYVLTGVGVVSGSLTGLGWWAFKRSKGDPWSWLSFVDFELLLGERERVRGILEAAIGMERMERPELIWDRYMELENEWNEHVRVRDLYERCLLKTTHIKIFVKYSKFEAECKNMENARAVIERGLEIYKNEGANVDRASLLSHALKLEMEFGDQKSIEKIKARQAKKALRKRKLEDGQTTEDVVFIFPDDGGQKSKILEKALKWKQKTALAS